MKCLQCPGLADFDDNLCCYCAIELTSRLLASEPDPEVRTCKVCKAAIQYTEARVLRNAKNPQVGSKITPYLCWVCARLHLSVIEETKEENRAA